MSDSKHQRCSELRETSGPESFMCEHSTFLYMNEYLGWQVAGIYKAQGGEQKPRPSPCSGAADTLGTCVPGYQEHCFMTLEVGVLNDVKRV